MQTKSDEATNRDEELRDEITSIIYGADWKSSDIADAFKPDVEAAMKLMREYGLEQRIDEHFKYGCAKELNMDMDEWSAHRVSELTTLKAKETL